MCPHETSFIFWVGVLEFVFSLLLVDCCGARAVNPLLHSLFAYEVVARKRERGSTTRARLRWRWSTKNEHRYPHAITKARFACAQALRVTSLNYGYVHVRTLAFLCHRTNLVSVAQQITVTDVHDVLQEYVYDHCPVVAGVGPTEDLMDYEVLRSKMYLLPF